MQRKTAVLASLGSIVLATTLVGSAAATTEKTPPPSTCASAGMRCQIVTINGVTGLFISTAGTDSVTTTAPPTTEKPPSTTVKPSPAAAATQTTHKAAAPTTHRSVPAAPAPPHTSAPLPGAVNLDQAQLRAEAQANGYGAPLAGSATAAPPRQTGVVPAPVNKKCGPGDVPPGTGSCPY